MPAVGIGVPSRLGSGGHAGAGGAGTRVRRSPQGSSVGLSLSWIALWVCRLEDVRKVLDFFGVLGP